MSDSNCNCCGCQYSTPPWWVTMGFVSPYNNQAVQSVPGNTTPVNGQNNPGITVPPPAGHQPQGSNGGLGGLLGNVGSTVGNVVGSVLGNPIGTATNVLGEVVNGIGGLLGKLF